VTRAFVGIGSNLQEPRRQVERAFEELAQMPQTRLVKTSSLYRSAPLGYASQPAFVNAAAELETALQPMRLLEALQAIETRHGRERSFANAPRTLDLDLLLYGEQELNEPSLTVPHPRLHERAFVLRPLVELEPGLSIPGRGAAQDYLAACASQSAERLP
jgi:2-amino-4-hydroxy-6-hydroxymethyldihydropteridine diphosphokinase